MSSLVDLKLFLYGCIISDVSLHSNTQRKAPLNKTPGNVAHITVYAA